MATAENLGPAEHILRSILTYTDHMVHNRPGMVTTDARTNIGLRWEPVTHKVENDKKVVYKLTKVGKKTNKMRVGVLGDDKKIRTDAGQALGEYREPGLFPEVAFWMYTQVAEVWKLDNEFAARWASYSYRQEHRDIKAVMAAFMLVQSRKGDPVMDGGKIAFHDEDYRDVGEAMCLLIDKNRGKRADKEDFDFDPKALLRVYEVLTLPKIAQLNRDLGFGHSARKPFLGRWPKAVEKFLRYREENPKMLEGLIKKGWRTSLMRLAQLIGYKPSTPKFFELLRWKQVQTDDGRRSILIGADVAAAESWEGLTEEQVCERITKQRLDWKRVTGLLPKNIGITRAVVAAAVESGAFSDKDMIIFTPTLEELNLLDVPTIKARWEKASKAATDTRAANIARNVQSKALKEKLQDTADTAVKAAVEEVTKNLRIYFIVDISGSMEGAIELAKEYVAKFLQGFPPNRLHVSVFNTQGREVEIKHASKAGVENAFKGIKAGGGTHYGTGVKILQHKRPQEDEDVLMIFVGDEEATTFEADVIASGLKPVAFGLLKILPNKGAAGWRANQYGVDKNEAVRGTAAKLGIPCFMIQEETFADPYAIPRTIRALVAATPVGQRPQAAAPRHTLVEQILKTELLVKPDWAA